MKSIAIILFALFSVTASASRSIATPLTCHVEIGSADGGRIELTRNDHSRKLPVDIPLQFGWHPPVSGSAADLVVGYQGGTVKRLGDPSGAYLSFTPSANKDPNDYVVRVSTDDGESWNFDRGDIEVGPERDGVGFDKSTPRGTAIVSAIRDGKRIKVEMIVAGKVDKSETFDTSAIKGRDTLLTKAVQMVDASDPSVCKPIGLAPMRTFP